MDSIEVWSLKITSPNAYSLNFIFSELYLPEGTEPATAPRLSDSGNEGLMVKRL
jgi:hypothetical protein